MSADKGTADESGKAPGLASREQTGGGEDLTQTGGTTGQAMVTAPAPSPPKGGSDSKREKGSGSFKGSGRGLKSPPPAAPIEGDAVHPPEGTSIPEKTAPAPSSAPRVAYNSMSASRKKRKERKKAAAAAGTIEETGVAQEAEPEAYPGENEAALWRQLEVLRRANMVQSFPVEPSPEQLAAELAHTYVKTIELTMEMRWRKIGFNRFLTCLLFISTLISVFIFLYDHVYNEPLHVWEWKKTGDWPIFMYPLLVHFVSWPLCTVPLVFCHRYYFAYLAAANAYLLPLFSHIIATGFILYLPMTQHFEDLIEHAVDYEMITARHLEDAKTAETRRKICHVYMSFSFWAFVHFGICCYTFHISMRTLSALRYYKNHSYEADRLDHRPAHNTQSGLIGQCTRRVPLTNYRNIADTDGTRTPRTPLSCSVPNSPMAATAIAEGAPLI